MFKSGFDYMTLRPPTPLEVFALVMFSVLHQVGFLLLFTEPGFGDEIYRALNPYAAFAYTVGWVGVIFAIALYLVDAHVWRFWGKAWSALAALLFSLAALLLIAGLILVVGDYPQAPLCVYLFFTFAAQYGLRATVFSGVSMERFLLAIAAPTFFGGLVMFAGWVFWIAATGEVWSGATRRRYYSTMLCDPAATACLPAAILYFSPMACGLLNVACGFVYYLLALSTRPRKRKTLHISVRIFAGAVFLVLGAMYVQAAVSGANSSLANTVLLFALAALVAMTAMVGHTVGWAIVHAKLMNVPLLKKAYAAMLNDWARALLVFGGWMPISLFMLVALIKQRLRAAFWMPRGSTEWTDLHTDIRVVRAAWLTDSAGALWDQLSAWQWTTVLSRAIWAGIFFMVMNVGFGKLTNVFVAWLIEALLLAEVGLGVVVAVVVFVGLIFFMLPPVPGFAVYLMASFLIPRFVPFWTGVLLSITISFGLKLTACMIQQKIIGQQMGGLIAVRSLIGINSTTTRAIRKLLSTPGWGIGKICILVGGPDWPTSVCCGILNLSLLPILLGTTPVLIVVSAVTVAGAAQLRKNEGGVWSSVSSMTLGLASAVMFVTLVASAYFIEDTAEKYREELEKLPRDEEVDAADRKKSEAARIFGAATAWSHPERPTPWWMRANLVIGTSLQIFACYAAQFFGRACFAPFEMTDSIAVQLDGDWTNLFLPLGRAVLLIWLVSCANLLVFKMWAKQRVKAFLADGEQWPSHAEEGKRVSSSTYR